MLGIGCDNIGRSWRRRRIIGNKINRLRQRHYVYTGVADMHAFIGRENWGRAQLSMGLTCFFLF